MAKKKQMQYWNGRTQFHRRDANIHACICAFSKAEAVRLGQQIWPRFSVKELNEYWSNCWGTAAKEVLGEQTEPALFLTLDEGYVHVFRYEGTHERKRH